jgi:membrane protein DedA with SNARE-associated domain
MDFDVTSMLQWFSAYAYQPWIVYSAVLFLLTASSFGLPVPEEVTLVSVGLLAYLAKNPEKFPPPEPGATPVNVYALMVICFFAVFLSDALVFAIGKYGGTNLKKRPSWKKFFRSRAFRKAEVWAKHHGAIMSGVFRFTPGLRFPGHMICGMMGLPFWKFALVDGGAALLSVPTQIWFVATYGEEILGVIKQFKLIVLSLIAIGLLVYFARRFYLAREKANKVKAS